VAPVHCGEGIANHIGPEPCVVGREAGGEASVGVPIGQPLSRERINRDADAVVMSGRQNGGARQRERVFRSCVVEDPGMYVRSSTGNRETSTLAAREVSGPHREGDEPKPMMHGDEGSDSAMSHCEASERGPTGGGVRGAKGGGRGDRATGRSVGHPTGAFEIESGEAARSAANES